jgi:hypothetical protein
VLNLPCELGTVTVEPVQLIQVTLQRVKKSLEAGSHRSGR